MSRSSSTTSADLILLFVDELQFLLHFFAHDEAEHAAAAKESARARRTAADPGRGRPPPGCGGWPNIGEADASIRQSTITEQSTIAMTFHAFDLHVTRTIRRAGIRATRAVHEPRTLAN